jgi:hypothetical protein
MSSGHFIKHFTITDMVIGRLASARNIFLLVFALMQRDIGCCRMKDFYDVKIR